MFRRDYREDPGLVARVLPVLGAVFLGLTAREKEARRQGLRWEDVSVPFLRFSVGRPIAHVGLLEIPLVIDGAETIVGGIHAVATLPDHRRRGYARELLAEAIDYGLDHYGTLTLTTDDPRIYEPRGFRTIAETRFVTDRPPPRPGGRPAVRRLDRRSPDDTAMLRRLLSERTPVSNRFGVGREEAVFLFNTAFEPLDVADDLEIVVFATVEDRTLRLFDVVAREMPPLAEILARYVPVDRVEIYFAPDRLDADLTPEPFLLDGNDHLMALGPFAAEGTPFMWPVTARS